MPGLSFPVERSGCWSKPLRLRSGARNPAVELSGSLFDRGVVVNPRVEIARPIGTLFITPETGGQIRSWICALLLGLLLVSEDVGSQTPELSWFVPWADSLKGCVPTILALLDRAHRPRELARGELL